MGSSADNRYKLGTPFLIPNYPIPANHTLTTLDIAIIVHAVASFEGNGLDFYHVFLPQGVDMCFPARSWSLTPVLFPGQPRYVCLLRISQRHCLRRPRGHVIFSLEPYHTRT